MVEVLIGLLLTAFLFHAVVLLLSTSLMSWNNSVSRTVTHQSARMSVEAMTRELRFATSIASPLPDQEASSIRFTQVDSEGKTQTLTFHQGLSSGKNAQTLYRTHLPGQPAPLTQNIVSAVSFRFQPPRLIIISLTLTDPQTQVADSVQTSIVCANIPD